MLNRDGLFSRRDIKTEDTVRKETFVTPHHAAGNASHSATSARASPFGDNVRTQSVASSADAKSSDASEGSKLIVGPNIQLKGVEISNCDVLSVEGHVEATVGSRTLHIAQPGTFSGQADIEIAEIQGEFTGDLTARKKLVILATGKVSGKIRYGKLVIEEGGELSGDVKTIGNANEDVSLKGPTHIAPGLAPKPILPATH